MADEIIKAHCGAQEYWFIRQNKCSCGGELKPGIQTVGRHLDIMVDRITTTCESCGQSRVFVFDISTFFDRSSETIRIIRALSGVQDEQLKDKILKMAGPPMESTLGFIMELGEAKDMLALEYIQAVIEYTRNKGQATER